MSDIRLLFLCVSLIFVTGCTQKALFQNDLVEPAHVTDRTRAGDILVNLPAPEQKLAVASYEFQDQTGQFKYNDRYTDYSSAVTKGGHAILTKALMDAGDGQWFSVIERGGLKNLLQERQIIKIMRDQYRAPGGKKLSDLPPMLYAGMLIEGGIISYDTNIVTGGIGAAFLGVSASTQYRRDIVAVYLRAVNVQNGEVMLSVTSTKTIFSVGADANVLKYVTFDRLLQAEAGFSVNEPVQLGVRQAIETGVYSMIMEGAIKNLWKFKDKAAGQAAIEKYLELREEQTYRETDEEEFKKRVEPKAEVIENEPTNPRTEALEDAEETEGKDGYEE